MYREGRGVWGWGCGVGVQGGEGGKTREKRDDSVFMGPIVAWDNIENTLRTHSDKSVSS